LAAKELRRLNQEHCETQPIYNFILFQCACLTSCVGGPNRRKMAINFECEGLLKELHLVVCSNPTAACSKVTGESKQQPLVKHRKNKF